MSSINIRSTWVVITFKKSHREYTWLLLIDDPLIRHFSHRLIKKYFKGYQVSFDCKSKILFNHIALKSNHSFSQIFQKFTSNLRKKLNLEIPFLDKQSRRFKIFIFIYIYTKKLENTLREFQEPSQNTNGYSPLSMCEPA